MKKIVLITIMFVVALSCEKNEENENCLEYKNSFVLNIDAPSNGTVNEDIIIEVFFSVINGCGNFNKFIEVENGNTTTIEVQAKYEGCFCTHAVETRSINYIFSTQTAGDYEFKFKSGENEFITAIITVE